MIDLIKNFVSFILHINVHLKDLIIEYGTTTYWVLFAIIFAETGLVVLPFLPGDSLLFAAGTFCADPQYGLNVHLLAFLLWFAAFLGDTVNYWVGAKVGPKVFTREDSVWLRKKHLEKAHAFFEKYGGRAIILARFVPIVRTFVPFVAGIGKMTYSRFLAYNIIGGFIWIYTLTYLGFAFGQIEIVQKNFELVILAIIALSVLPIVIEFIKARREAKNA